MIDKEAVAKHYLALLEHLTKDETFDAAGAFL